MSEWVVFFDQMTGSELCAYDLKHTFRGEMYAAVELLASENGLSSKNIRVELHHGKKPYVMGEGIVVSEGDIGLTEERFDKALRSAVGKLNALPKEPALKTTVFCYTGMGDFGMPAYKDSDGRIWLDVNLGHGEPDLHLSSNGALDGEPDTPAAKIFSSWSFRSKYEPDAREMGYAMLNRLIADCKYAIYASGYSGGRIYPGHLYYGDVDKQIAEMKRLYNSFPDDGKPVWTSMEELEEYETILKGNVR